MLETLSGTIESVSRVFNSGWRLGTLTNGTKIVGAIPEDAGPGDFCVFQGSWKNHPRYGKQFDVVSSSVDIPQDVVGIIHYLDRHIPWIGPITGRLLIDKFGDTLFDVIEHHPEKLVAIKSISPERADKIHEAFIECKGDQETDLFFSTHRIGRGTVARLIDRYGDKRKAMQHVRADPYSLADEVWGVGFLKSDVIAQSLGIPNDHPLRLSAGLRWVLQDAGNGEGHCCLPEQEYMGRSIRILGGSARDIAQRMVDEIEKGRIIRVPNGCVANVRMWEDEKYIARKIRAMAALPIQIEAKELDAKSLEEMDDDQSSGLWSALQSRISVITGQPGCGKTWLIRTIIEALGDRRIALAAPTGKAAKRMFEATSREASTIHRLLEFSPFQGGFSRNESMPLEEDTIIIDESSMIDTSLMRSLMEAIPVKAHVIFVGDVDQLPSVGAGRVLADLIESGAVPVARLRQLHRQSKDSLIAINAQLINAGRGILYEREGVPDNERDFWFIPEEDKVKLAEAIVTACQRIPEVFKYRLDDIQVLCPQKKGPVGTFELNRLLRPVLNPEGVPIPGVNFMTGDRVIQTRNNYELEIFNGDIGKVVGFNPVSCSGDPKYLLVQFESGKDVRNVMIPIGTGDLEDLQLAYALTIHKCVAAETLIETNQGLVEIQNINPTGVVASHIGPKPYVDFVSNSPSKLITIETRDGYKITTTPDHGMDVWDGEKYSRKTSSQIIPGDFLRLKLGAVIDPKHLIQTPKPSNGDAREVVFEIPSHVDESFAEFLGLFVADGTLFHAGFRIAKRHQEVSERFAELCLLNFGTLAKQYKKMNAYYSEISSTFLSRWLESFDGIHPNNKAIPECILQSPLRVQAKFLRGLFEDGSVLLKNGKVDHIEFSNKSQRLIDTARIMLLRFGIISGTTTSTQPNIQIYSNNIKRFKSTIGFVSNLKNRRIELPVGNETRYVAPISRKEALSWYLSNKTAFGKFNYQNSRDRGYISRYQLNRLSKRCNNVFAEQIEDKLSYHHSRVLVVEESCGPSFCIEVPDGHQFLQNGFCGWNSQGSEFPVVVMPMHSTNHIMLKRNLFYTALTRARKMAVVVGTKKAVNTAIRTEDSSTRYTSLKHLLVHGVEGSEEKMEIDDDWLEEEGGENIPEPEAMGAEEWMNDRPDFMKE